MSQLNFDNQSSGYAAQAMGAPGQPAPMPDMGGPQPMGPMGPGPGMQPQAPVVQKQRFSVYTMMLILSFFALLTACLLLWFELSDYMDEGSKMPWDTSGISLLEQPIQFLRSLA